MLLGSLIVRIGADFSPLTRDLMKQVINGFMRPWPKLRREIAEALHIPENELFDEEGKLIKSDAEYIKIPLKKYA